ncbi:MAG: transposase [Ktedonobacteraceae bacterium]
MTNQVARKPYPSDVTDAQWEMLAPLIPEPGVWSPREPISRQCQGRWNRGSCNFLVKHFQAKKLEVGSTIHQSFVCFDFVDSPFDGTL